MRWWGADLDEMQVRAASTSGGKTRNQTDPGSHLGHDPGVPRAPRTPQTPAGRPQPRVLLGSGAGFHKDPFSDHAETGKN